MSEYIGYTVFMSSKKSSEKYMLIDGNALIHRGFHAIPGLSTKSGEPTGAVYGFTQILLRAIKDIKPTYIACTFDLAGPTFRHDADVNYKATRVKAAQELYDQIPRVKEVVESLGIPIFEKPGFEADDCLGTLAHEICKKHSHKDCEVLIVTGDMDTLQLVNDCVKVYTLKKGLTDVIIYDIEAVKKRFDGLLPSQMIDYKALRGDPSDNIKGVRGIGEKGAINLIQTFGSIVEMYKQIHSGEAKDKLKPRFFDLLKESEEDAKQSYFLSTIVTNVPIEVDIKPYVFGQKELSQIIPLFQELEFKSLLDKLPKSYMQGKDTEQEEEQKPIKHNKHTNLKQDYTLIKSEAELETLVEKLLKVEYLAIDTETTSTDPMQAKLVGVSLCAKPGESYYVPAAVLEKSKSINKLLESQVKKVGHNIKYDLIVLEQNGFKVDNANFDTMIAAYLINSATRAYSLDTLAFNEFGYQMQPIEDLIGKGKNQITMDQVEIEKVSWYAAEDADFTFRLKELYKDQLKEEGVEKIFEDIEMPLIPVLKKMEETGIIFDVDKNAELIKEGESLQKKLEKQIYKLAEKEFNINSPKQLKEILFVDLGLQSPENGKKVKTGVSTAAGELEKMLGQHPIIENILQYREVTKLLSTYLLALPELVNPKTGRIHTSYNQTIASTGRLSSTEPNLQNIPAKGTGLSSEIRKAFVAKKGCKLLSLDYSQIELRIVAHVSGDDNMKGVFSRGEDIHTNTATQIFNVEPDKITKDMRRDAKAINFGVLYGLSAFGLSYNSGLNWGDAKSFIDKYYSSYPGVKKYLDTIKKQVHKDEFIKNELGRVRKFPEINSSIFPIRGAAERAAINFPIQSLAADIIKVAMINIDKELEGKEDIKMLLQVHDELVFEVENDRVEFYAKKIKKLMEEAIEISVPTVVEAKAGNNWGDMNNILLQ